MLLVLHSILLYQAKEPIKAGDVLILEKPYAAVLVPGNKNTHCSQCFEPLDEDFKYVYMVYGCVAFCYGWVNYLLGISHKSLTSSAYCFH